MNHDSRVRRACLACSGVLILLAGCGSPASLVTGAETVYLNGNIVTGLPGAAPDAVAVRGGRIIYVGSAEGVVYLTTDNTEIVDLDGNTMLPGLYDNHVHAAVERGELMEWEGGLISEVPAWVREARSISDLQAALQREAAATPPGEWIVGALSREIWHNGILPTRAGLDVGTSEHPVLLTRGPHTTVLNSKALELAGIDRNTVTAVTTKTASRTDGCTTLRVAWWPALRRMTVTRRGVTRTAWPTCAAFCCSLRAPV